MRPVKSRCLLMRSVLTDFPLPRGRVMRERIAQYLGMLLLALAPLFILVLVGCSSSSDFGGRERKQAPRGKADVGVLVQKASRQEVQNILDLYPQASVRI